MFNPEQPTDLLGRRVAIGGERATVRFAGLVPPTTGFWLGVEWDDPKRGKHDGTHEGVQYFTCRHPTGGSFVRPEKASFGVDFLTALRREYEFDTEEELSQEVIISSKKLKWSDVQCRFEKLPVAMLKYCEVNGPGEPGEIRNTTPNIEFLNLDGSLLTSWEDVAAITKQLDQLHELHLSENRLRLPFDPSAHCLDFSSLKTLILNRCELTWKQILECAPMWPQLEHLSVEYNQIAELQRPEGVLQTLVHLDLYGNPLVQDSLLSISALPRLDCLNLTATGISAIQFEDAPPGRHTSMFPALTHLIVDQNNITEGHEHRTLPHLSTLEERQLYGRIFFLSVLTRDRLAVQNKLLSMRDVHLCWSVVNELSKLPSLKKLSCRGNRLVSSDGNPATANQMLIAKLGQLVTLNGCEIEPLERRGAELDYIKMFGEEWLKAGGPGHPSTHFTNQHPRYQELINKYGAPEEGELKKPGPSVLKNQLLKITFTFPDDSSRKPIEKRLPASMVVQKVKGLLYRLLKVPPSDLRLTYTSTKMVGAEFELSNDLKTLQFYSIEDGDQILVRWS
ncbi:tubulin-specific chaperone E isoform X1 [Nothobranchius furzeri]|uniref:Tubulin-specific chaperone E n=1 Tax=Nothobranchius furzeri TaxID=105023 RepID=A0A9D3BMI8_NOTFU|nr:transcript variant X1 [Nothobranchius furzeri]